MQNTENAAPVQHTPGPWKLFDGKTSSEKGGQLIISGLPRLDIIAKVYADTATFGEFTPDARLLAAAPNLLAALKLCREWLMEEKGSWRGTMDQIDAAIAKAEGRCDG